MTPLVSIIMPVYNGEAYLPMALDSLVQQTDLDQMEIIALDDGSTDRSMELLHDYATRLPIVIAPSNRTGNWVANTNRGIAMALGRYVCFLHQDDLWREGRLAWIHEVTRRHPECPVLFSAADYLSPDHRTVGRWTAPFSRRGEQVLEPMAWFCPLLVQNYLAIPAPVIRRDVLVPLDEQRPYAADWKCWLSLARAHTAIYEPRATVGFRVHAESQTCSMTSDPEAYRLQLQSVLRECESFAPDTRDGRRWRAAAELGLVANAMMAAAYHRRPAPWRVFGSALWDAGFRGTARYVTASRLIERLGARINVLLRAAPTPRR
jgi:hypothetical protein